MTPASRLLSGLAAAMLLGAAVPSVAQIDAKAAQALVKKDECTKCHAVEKDKKGPSYKKIAAKYKGKSDGQEKTIKNMTVASKVKLDDGTEDDHKVLSTKDEAAIKNLAAWILAQ